jgi:hypothetical protein
VLQAHLRVLGFAMAVNFGGDLGVFRVRWRSPLNRLFPAFAPRSRTVTKESISERDNYSNIRACG